MRGGGKSGDTFSNRGVLVRMGCNKEEICGRIDRLLEKLQPR